MNTTTDSNQQPRERDFYAYPPGTAMADAQSSRTEGSRIHNDSQSDTFLRKGPSSPARSYSQSLEQSEDVKSVRLDETSDDSDVENLIKDDSRCQRALNLIRSARAEIFLLLHVFAHFMVMTPLQDLVLDKACRYTLRLNSSVCDSIDDYPAAKDSAEQIASLISMLSTIAAALPSVVIAIFIGPWCDKYGYKTPLLTASVGYMISVMCLLATVIRMDLPLYLNIISALPDGLSGGTATVMTAVLSQATVTTKVEDRRVRFLALTLTMSVGAPMASYVGGHLYGLYGCKIVLYASFAFISMALLWALLMIPNLALPENARDSVWTKFRNLFRKDNISQGYRACLKPRPDRGRAQLWCMFGTMCCMVLDFMSVSISYYFVRKMYSWSVTFYSTVSTVASLVGAAFNVPLIYVFSRILKMTDPGMALVGACFGVCQMVLLGLAYQPWLYYLQCFVGIPVCLSQVGVRSHLSKLLSQDEVGKVFAFLATFDAMMPIVGSAMFTGIFNWSIDFLPGLSYLVAACITLISVGLLSFCTKVTRDKIIYEEMSKTDDGPHGSGDVRA